ncbi:cupin domain-containing protein [Canibacter oris]|uniref:DUF985 domain-containing protein n=1 Tax=Canibacter oris TaxID=1365628 RepID=A0A840DJV6_9MICO|nr:cupin domain-containing protein [Canibacter oris]MBB4071983.1 hypothetical protein [Canibacter oris]
MPEQPPSQSATADTAAAAQLLPAESTSTPAVQTPTAILPAAAAELAKRLRLEPLPHEGGMFRNTLASDVSSAIYYLLTAGDFSALHSLTAAEVYHWYAGDPLELLVLLPDGNGYTTVVGDPLAGFEPQTVIPADAIHGSRSRGSWTLVGTTMAPAFSWEGFALIDRATALTQYPEFAELITALTRH